MLICIREKMTRFTSMYLSIKTNILRSYTEINEKFLDQFGFRIRDASCTKIINYLNAPKDSSSLAITRILFGICMLFDIPDERGGASMNTRWGDPTTCHFPLLPFVTAFPMPYMALVYLALWLGALGITLGYRFSFSSWTFTTCYWYLLLIEKSFWNNHSYLFGLIALLLSCTQAGSYWSIDALLDPSSKKTTVPYWNYFILKYQFFILYFMAGMKKGTAEWLTGYSVQKLSEHWVFNPLKFFLTVSQIDYVIVHWFTFAFDLTVAIWMMWSKTRHVAVIFCVLFHLMNSRLFTIGMFPWVCLVTIPLFYPFDWPKVIFCKITSFSIPEWCNTCIHLLKSKLAKRQKVIKCNSDVTTNDETNDSENINVDNVAKAKDHETNGKMCDEKEKVTSNDDCSQKKVGQKKISKCEERCDRTKKRIFLLISFHVVTQAILPYSHFITKGYNNWTNGLYGYSWDMMVHTWDVYSVVVKIVDNENKAEYFIDPYVYSPNDRWTRHGDMVYQYAHCLKDRLLNAGTQSSGNTLSKNISIYIDVWCSMNGRFTQRMFSKSDFLNVSWSPFKQMPYIMPLLDEGLKWRSTLQNIKEDVHSWNNYTDVVFIADFPGYEHEKFIPEELVNVTLTILKGAVVYEPEMTADFTGQSHRLNEGDHMKLDSKKFHRVLSIGSTPAFYMYTFANLTEASIATQPKPILPIGKELSKRYETMSTFAFNIFSNIFRISQCQSCANQL